MLFICTAMFKVLTPVLSDFSISHQPIWMTSSYPWECYGISWKTWKKMCDLMITKHHLVPGCVHAHRCPSLSCASDSIRDRHLRGEQLCKIVSFSKSGSGFNYLNKKKSGYEIDTLFFQITKMLLKCITLYFFLNTCFWIRILSS